MGVTVKWAGLHTLAPESARRRSLLRLTRRKQGFCLYLTGLALHLHEVPRSSGERYRRLLEIAQQRSVHRKLLSEMSIGQPQAWPRRTIEETLGGCADAGRCAQVWSIVGDAYFFAIRSRMMSPTR